MSPAPTRTAAPDGDAPGSVGPGRAHAEALHPLHRLWRLLPAEARRRLLADGVAILAPRPDRDAPSIRGGVAIGGEVERASGLGEGARLMHRALVAAAVPSWLMAAGVGRPGEAADVDVEVRGAPPPAGAGLILHVNAPLLPAAMLRLGRGAVRGRCIVGYWAWELPAMPPTWAAGLRFVHEVWVPSRFVADAVAGLIGAGPGPRVRVVPHPVAAAPPLPARLDRAAFGLPDNAVVTLVSFNLASSMARKNPLGAVAAFRAAFGDRPDRILMLKLAHTGDYPADLAAIASAAGGARNIRIETRTMPRADSHALTACSDVVFSPHRSEGFGLVLAEAMVLGRAVVATGWSGNMDFCDEDCAALVGYRLVPASDPRGTYAFPGACWAEPDLGAAAAHLARLADDAPARTALGARAADAARLRLGAGPLLAALSELGLEVAARR